MGDRSLPRVGIKGVRLKKYEEAVAYLLPNVTPQFSRLPKLPPSSRTVSCCTVGDGAEQWPFDSLPCAARVAGDEPGKLKGARAMRKEGQLRSMLRCVVAMLSATEGQEGELTTLEPATIVDFCGGTGHLALPLALLFPQCKVVVVDIGARSLALCHEKALQFGGCDVPKDYSPMREAVERQQSNVTYQEQVERQCLGIPNLYTFHGSIETYAQHFDIGVALHACGEASDVTLRACAKVGAAFCVSPCCVGKLHRNRQNPYVYHATAGNAPTISYPQSTVVAECLKQGEDDLWNDLARAADYSDLMQVRTPRNATRRTAKALLERDRLLYMKEQHGYQTALTRMDPWESSPKNDILLGWIDCASSPYHGCELEPDDECNADIDISKHHLLETTKVQHYGQQRGTLVDSVDWTMQEEEDVRAMLTDFLIGEEGQWILPTGMGPRKRKLVHFMAEQMGLAHWCKGKKYAEKTVVVAKRNDNSPSRSRAP